MVRGGLMDASFCVLYDGRIGLELNSNYRNRNRNRNQEAKLITKRV